MKRQAFTLLSAAALIFAATDYASAGNRDRGTRRFDDGRNRGRAHVRPVVRTPRRATPPRHVRGAGRYVWRVNRVFVPGHYENRWVERRAPDRFETREERVWQAGQVTYRDERYVVRAGYYRVVRGGACEPARRVWCPPQYGVRRVPVQCPGRWVVKCVRVRVPGEIQRVCERVWCPPRYENKRVRVWVPAATCTVWR